MNWEAYNEGFAAWDEYLKTNIKYECEVLR